MASIFTKIINREIPSDIVYEDSVCIAILDISPITPMHTLVIPKVEIDKFDNLPVEIFTHIMSVAQRLAQIVRHVTNDTRTMLLIEGFEIAHTHIKIFPTSVPMNDFSGSREHYDEYKTKYFNEYLNKVNENFRN